MTPFSDFQILRTLSTACCADSLVRKSVYLERVSRSPCVRREKESGKVRGVANEGGRGAKSTRRRSKPRWTTVRQAIPHARTAGMPGDECGLSYPHHRREQRQARRHISSLAQESGFGTRRSRRDQVTTVLVHCGSGAWRRCVSSSRGCGVICGMGARRRWSVASAGR